MKTSAILLHSGESLTREEVMEAFLLLARAEADFPIIGEQDAHMAVLLRVPELLEFNRQEDII